MSGPTGEAAPSPTLAVLRGRPEPEELAALLAVVTALSAQQSPATGGAAAHRTTGWSAPWRQLHAPVPVGPGAWTASRW